MSETDFVQDAWSDACLIAGRLDIAPSLGGAVLRANAGPVRDAWIDGFRLLLTDDTPWRRIPSGISDEAFLGGVDLAATLRTGRPVRQAGLLYTIGSGVGMLAMAEQAEAGLAARLSTALDGRDEISGADAALAARRVMATRATRLPVQDEEDPAPPEQPGEVAQAEASHAARLLRAAGHVALVVNVSKRDADKARDMALEMGALYARLPVANPAALAEQAREAAG